MKNKNYNEAIDAFTKSLNLAPNNVEIQKELARAYHLSGQYTKAVEVYNQILAKDKDNYDILLDKALALHGNGDVV